MGYYTYADAIGHCTDYMGSDQGAQAERYARRAIQAGLVDMAKEHDWSYYNEHSQMYTNAAVTTGTVQYQVSSGTYPYQVTLTGSTWPPWAAFGELLLNTVRFDVDQVKSPTILTLKGATAPVADVAAGNLYTLFRDIYTLPPDFRSASELMLGLGNLAMLYVSPSVWNRLHRVIQGPGTPLHYSFAGDPDVPGRMALYLYPPPDQNMNIHFMYNRLPYPPQISAQKAGTVSAVAGTTTVLGNGTAFNKYVVGSVLRIAFDISDWPTGLDGASPFQEEHLIMGVTDGATLTTKDPILNTVAGVRYVISDAIDIELGSMLTLFKRECERQARIIKRMQSTKDEMEEYRNAKLDAWAADSRNYDSRSAGERIFYPYRLANFPYDPST